MRTILVAWIGKSDLRAPAERESVGQGPIAQELSSLDFDETFLQPDIDDELVQPYVKWREGRFDPSAEFLPDLVRDPDKRLKQCASGVAPQAPLFAEIIHESRATRRHIEHARPAAVHCVPVRLEGVDRPSLIGRTPISPLGVQHA